MREQTLNALELTELRLLNYSATWQCLASAKISKTSIAQVGYPTYFADNVLRDPVVSINAARNS